MAKLKDIIKILDEIAPFSLAEDWDNSGLQVGSLSMEINKILLALNPTIMAVKKAMERDAQLLLTHHPLIFSPLSCVDIDSYPGNVLNEALKNSISIVAIHTNLDAARTGINQILAEIFELNNAETLESSEGLENTGSGIGRVGNLKEPATLSNVSNMVKRSLGIKGLRVMGKGETEIRRIAIVGGSGGSMAPSAFKKGADLLITGDIKHNEALAAEAMDLCLIDGGHFSTERTALVSYMEYLKDIFKKKDLNIILEVYGDEKDPMRYE
jgi:dinuclear metal center YbgI/SA1388 family protein